MQNPPAHELHMTTLITPALANFTASLHAADSLKFLNQFAYACATPYQATISVPLSWVNVIFKEPIHVGELVNYYASVNLVGRTSMEIGIRVEAENIQTRSVRHTNSCYFTMVAMKDGKPVAVPPLALQTEQQIQRHAAAQQRKKMRLQANS